ncbi:MAG TPA: hypothetical protein VK826_01710, partial [Bacteroidia bacterium]|nr:hypothetical protein [Bacteroidia bacterium]
MKSLAAFRLMLTDVKERYSLMTLTVIGLTAGIFVYFFYFLAVRANELDQRQYRVLNRIENRIEANLAGYINLAKEQGLAAETEVVRKIIEDDKKPAVILEKVKTERDYLSNKLRDVAFLKNKKIAHGQLVLKDAEVSKSEQIREGDSLIVTAKHDTLHDSLLVMTTQMPFNVSGLIEGLNGIKPEEKDSIRKFISSNKASINFKISVGALVRPLLRYDMFDQFLVVKDEKIIYETFSTGLKKFAVDTIDGEDNSFKAGTSAVRRIHINGEHFRVYQVGFVMGEERGWTIVGLKSADKFAAEKRTIPRVYLFTLFIAIVFVILAIPFIKSMLMSRTERLGTADAIFSTVSLGIATSVVCILLLDGYMQQGLDRPQREKQLDDLSVVIEKNIRTEV